MPPRTSSRREPPRALPFESGTRTFRIWDYSVSHRRLLLRSPRERGSNDRNVDITFAAVELIVLPSSLGSFILEEGPIDDTTRALLPGTDPARV